jgi:hypothetical protein
MKKIIARIFIYLVSVVIITVFLLCVLPIAKDDYFISYKEKCKRIETLEGPRLIFVSGSKLAYGLDSKRIQDSLHINVVNMGLSSYLGFRYILDDVSQYIKDGDIVVLAPIYNQFYGMADGLPTGEFTFIIDEMHWRKIGMLNINQYVNVLRGIPNVLRGKITTNLVARYEKRMNEYGDEFAHWSKNSVTLPDAECSYSQRDFDTKFASYFVNKINEIKQKAHVVMYPIGMYERLYACEIDYYNEIADYLEKEGIQYLRHPSECVLKDEYIYDIGLHLNKKGVDAYTAMIIDDLRTVVNSYVHSYVVHE